VRGGWPAGGQGKVGVGRAQRRQEAHGAAQAWGKGGA
jgi:hypothetical protein